MATTTTANTAEANIKSSEGKKLTARFITCINCRKKFTQTIYGKKASLPICPYCYTINKRKHDTKNRN